MAQSDIFVNFINTVTSSTNRVNGLQNAIDKLYQGEANIYKIKQDLLKADTDSLNVLKRTSNVYNKFTNAIKNNKKMQDEQYETRKQLNKLEKQIHKTTSKIHRDNLIAQRNQLRTSYELSKVQLNQMRRSIPLLGKMGKTGAFFSDSIVKISPVLGGIFKIVGFIVGGIIKLGKFLFKLILTPLKKAFSIFLEMQKVVGNLAADIGLTGIESNTLLNNFTSLTLAAMKFGGSMKDVATIFSTFSQTTNKNRFFNDKEIGLITELGLGTALGVEGAADLAANFDNIGITLAKTINLTDKARNISAKMNLNSTKVLKTYQDLVQSLTGIGFGKGLDNLTKLAAKAAAIRFDINASTKAFSDAFFDPEKAVEASAQMQVLGGRFAQSFGDPMQLAFESMTDPSALAEKFAGTLSNIVAKDSKGNYFIPPAERKTLRLAAEALGQSYEDSVASAIEQAKIADKLSTIVSSGINLTTFNEEDRLAIASMMQLNDKGKFEIKMSDGTTQLLSNITDKRQLQQILQSRKANENAAIQRLNLMERLKLIVDRFMLGFSSVFNKLFAGGNFESFLQMVEKGGEKITEFIVKDLLGTNGLADGFSTLIDKAKNIFKEVEKIFGSGGTVVEKIGESLKLIFKDLAIPIISGVFNKVIPVFKTAIGILLEAIGRALPKALGGNKMAQAGLKMQSEAIASSPTLQKIIGQKSINSINEQINPNGTGGSGAQGAALYGKSAYQAMKAGSLRGGKGIGQLLQGGNMKKGAQAAKLIGGKGGIKALAFAAKRIPVLGALASAGFAINDLLEGDFAGAGLNTLSGLANVGNLFLPGVGSAVSMGIDAANAAREMGAFNDGVIYKDGSYAKFSKGDMVQFIDQAAYEKAMTGGSGGSVNNLQHSGVITIKSDDGKVVTWDQMYGARDLIGSRINSINDSYNNGFGNYQNSNKSPIKPLV